MTTPRRPIVAANWKMHCTRAAARELARGVRARTSDLGSVDVVLCPPFTALDAVAHELDGSSVGLGAQHSYWESEGAFTGEVSIAMLADAGCSHVIVGHSERRTLFGATDDDVKRTTRAVIDGGLTPIVCIGETLDEREGDRTEQVLRAQVETAILPLGAEIERIVVAYEPVWAIGTGRTATPEQVQETHAFIRGMLAESTRIQYGGSVKPQNAASIFSQPDVDGGLIGGAALDAESFAAIVRAAH